MSRYSAFLSYSREDEALVERLRGALKQRELSYWLDKSEIKGGDLWEALIRRALTQSDTLLVFVTKNIIGSFVEKETCAKCARCSERACSELCRVLCCGRYPCGRPDDCHARSSVPRNPSS